MFCNRLNRSPIEKASPIHEATSSVADPVIISRIGQFLALKPPKRLKYNDEILMCGVCISAACELLCAPNISHSSPAYPSVAFKLARSSRINMFQRFPGFPFLFPFPLSFPSLIPFPVGFYVYFWCLLLFTFLCTFTFQVGVLVYVSVPGIESRGWRCGSRSRSRFRCISRPGVCRNRTAGRFTWKRDVLQNSRYP